ncbi:hypothetical protein N752_10010 [Desulforamulus aquiferis]|nr:energy-coupling factor transporter transmembrane component T [Desulforamulus aquiferis]RYD05298.1 hypothetical protein N752_10010 [Desulforamulus aquiferis]
MILALAFNDIFYLMAVFTSVVAVAAIGKVMKDLAFVLKGLTIFAGILVLLQVLFFKGEHVLFYLLPGDRLAITTEAILLGLAMGLRMMTIVLSFLVFLATTQFKDIVLALTEKLKLPYDYVFMFMTALRFVPTFLSEAVQVSYAQQVRGCPVDSGNPFKKVKSYISVSLPLVLISLKKAERLAIAMETRGYGSSNRTYYKEPIIGKADLIFIALTVVIIIVALILRFQGLGLFNTKRG